MSEPPGVCLILFYQHPSLAMLYLLLLLLPLPIRNSIKVFSRILQTLILGGQYLKYSFNFENLVVSLCLRPDGLVNCLANIFTQYSFLFWLLLMKYVVASKKYHLYLS
jgi:hypothetical protein